MPTIGDTIRITCPKCNRANRTARRNIGKRVRCQCGEPFVVAETHTRICPNCGTESPADLTECGLCGSSFVRKMPVPAPVKPVRPADPMGANPAIVLEARASWKPWYVFNVFFAMVCFGAAYQIAEVRLAAIVFWAAMTAFVALGQTLHYYSSKLTVTPKLVSLRTGIIARTENEIRIEDIRNVLLKQGIFARILNYGTVGFSTAGQSDVEVVFPAVDDPKRIRDTVQELRP